MPHDPCPPSTYYQTEIIAADAFISGLRDENLEIRIRDKGPETLDQAFEAPLLCEANHPARRDLVKSSQVDFDRHLAVILSRLDALAPRCLFSLVLRGHFTRGFGLLLLESKITIYYLWKHK